MWQAITIYILQGGEAIKFYLTDISTRRVYVLTSPAMVILSDRVGSYHGVALG